MCMTVQASDPPRGPWAWNVIDVWQLYITGIIQHKHCLESPAVGLRFGLAAARTGES